MSAIAGVASWSRPGWCLPRLEAMLGVFQSAAPDGLHSYDRGLGAVGVALLRTSQGGAHGFHESGAVCGVVDGRLDNAAELRDMVGLESSAPDARIIVAVYERLGTECFCHLSGDFAVILWDARSQQVIAGRDPFAIRPLCFASGGDWFAVASDPEQMLAAHLTSGEPDDKMVVDYLLWDPRFPDRTFFRDVRAVEPSNFVVASCTGYRLERYRPKALRSVHLSCRDEYHEEYRRRFRAAVRSRIRSDRPIVAELSGGLDSSSIVCTADQLLAEDSSLCPAFAAAAGLYPGLACDEEPYIRAVGGHVSLPVRVWNGTKGVSDELDRSSRALPGGRFANFGGTNGQVEIAREVGARVLISGLGGDQVGTPSGVLRDAVTERRWRDATRIIVDRPGRSLGTISDTLAALARSFAPPELRRLRALLPRRRADRPWLRRRVRWVPRPRSEREAPMVLESEVGRRTWRSVSSAMHVFMMTYAQHHAMRSGLDARFPFLDVDLVSLILSTPSRFWPPAWPYERLHRAILARDLPAQVVSRRGKAEFTPAIVLRVRRHLPWIRDTFASSNWKVALYVSPRATRKLIQRFESQETPDLGVTYALWAISTVEAWLRAISGYYPEHNGLTWKRHPARWGENGWGLAL